MNKKNKKQEIKDDFGQPIMEVLIRISALEKILLQKKLITIKELTETTNNIVSDVVKTAKKELGVDIKKDYD